MKPTLLNYTKAVKPEPFYTYPKIVGHTKDTKIYPKTCIYKSPALKANFIQLKTLEQYLDTSNYNSSVYYVVSGKGRLNDTNFGAGDVLCVNSFAHICAEDNTMMYNVEDSPLMEYYNVKTHSRDAYVLHYSSNRIMDEIINIENQNEHEPNRLGVIFGTDTYNSISNTLWCLMTKTLPGVVQPPHRHNSVALDYCVKGKGYTLLSKHIDKDGNLVNPVRINWESGMVFLTPPGWWHSHHSTDDEPGYIFPVQDAGLHMHMDTLDITFS